MLDLHIKIFLVDRSWGNLHSRLAMLSGGFLSTFKLRAGLEANYSWLGSEFRSQVSFTMIAVGIIYCAMVLVWCVGCSAFHGCHASHETHDVNRQVECYDVLSDEPSIQHRLVFCSA